MFSPLCSALHFHYYFQPLQNSGLSNSTPAQLDNVCIFLPLLLPPFMYSVLCLSSATGSLFFLIGPLSGLLEFLHEGMVPVVLWGCCPWRSASTHRLCLHSPLWSSGRFCKQIPGQGEICSPEVPCCNCVLDCALYAVVFVFLPLSGL